MLIFRHGLAEDHGPDGDDASRRLTAEGGTQTTSAARGLRGHIADIPEVILTSPRVRAVQTAQILGKILKRTPQELDVLGDSSVPRILLALGERAESSIMIVGHEPTFSHLAAYLCTHGGFANFIELKKAGCICLDVAMDSPGILGAAQLIWLATPKMLRAMAGED